jgi:hypothetical protein
LQHPEQAPWLFQPIADFHPVILQAKVGRKAPFRLDNAAFQPVVASLQRPGVVLRRDSPLTQAEF